MSGDLATLNAAASAASALETLAFGAAGPVVLGSFAFQDFEVPETIVLPVAQAVAMHRLIGGERVFDAMGPDYGDICWTGTMLGADAEFRAQMLKALADSGEAVALTWGIWAFTVLPYRISLREAYQRIGYAIRCAVIRDDSAAIWDSGADLTGAVVQDLAAATAQGGPSLAATLSGLQVTLMGIAPLQPGAAGVAAAAAAVAAAQGQAGSVAAGAAASLAQSGARASTAPVASMGDLGTVSTQTGLLAQAASASFYLGRTAANLSANL